MIERVLLKCCRARLWGGNFALKSDPAPIGHASEKSVQPFTKAQKPEKRNVSVSVSAYNPRNPANLRRSMMNTIRSLVILLSITSVMARDLAATTNPRRNVRGTQKKNVAGQSHLKTVQNMKGKKAQRQAAQHAANAVLEKKTVKSSFDFVVAGFPKCGTTTLLHAFAAHQETEMAVSEQCAIAAPNQADPRVHAALDKTLSTLSADPNVKRSFKCPTSMYNHKTITRLEQHSPNSKLVIGMRHPVEMLQSFYNYRVTEIKERGLDHDIPALEDILERGTSWKGVSVESTRFDLFLMQLGKTNMSSQELKEIAQASSDITIKPNDLKIFLYTLDQLEDEDEIRTETFRTGLQDFLELKKPLQPFGHENKNHQTHDESIDICDDKWAHVRTKLVQEGAKTARWLEEKFLYSKDVFVANREHFLQTLKTWGTDPCLKSATA